MGGGRSLFWRYFLGSVSAPVAAAASDDSDTDDDPEARIPIRLKVELEHSRKTYTDWELAKKTAVVPRAPPAPPKAKKRQGPRFGDDSDDSNSDNETSVASQSTITNADNPLSAAENSAWSQYFAKQRIMELVDKDLARLWSGIAFFEDATTRAHLRDVLECLLDNDVITDYCQGMHELLSVVFLVTSLDVDAANLIDRSAPNYELLRLVFSAPHLKNDTYSLIRQILTSKKNGLGIARWYEADPDVDLDRPVVKQSQLIQGALLMATDPEVATHLTKKLDVQPAAYGLRWLRLLFLREFPIPQVATLWDAIFADHAHRGRESDPSKGIIPNVAVSMLLFIRNDIMQDDYALVLRRLMRFPPVESVTVLVQRAAILTYGAGSHLASLCGVAKSLLAEHETFSKVDPPPRPVERQSSEPPVNNDAASSRGNSPPSLFDAHPQPVSVRPTADACGATPATNREEAMGQALARVIDQLNSRWFPSESGPTPDDGEYLLAIAELKRVRDILLNGLPISTPLL